MAAAWRRLHFDCSTCFLATRGVVSLLRRATPRVWWPCSPPWLFAVSLAVMYGYPGQPLPPGMAPRGAPYNPHMPSVPPPGGMGFPRPGMGMGFPHQGMGMGMPPQQQMPPGMGFRPQGQMPPFMSGGGAGAGAGGAAPFYPPPFAGGAQQFQQQQAAATPTPAPVDPEAVLAEKARKWQELNRRRYSEARKVGYVDASKVRPSGVCVGALWCALQQRRLTCRAR